MNQPTTIEPALPAWSPLEAADLRSAAFTLAIRRVASVTLARGN